jgi:hypothetical protein
MAADFTTFMFPTHDHGDYDYMHDPRCEGDCGPCGGMGGIEAMHCLTCGGSGRCRGCNLYNTRTAE